MKKIIICMCFMIIIGCSNSSTIEPKDMTIYGYNATVISLVDSKHRKLSGGLKNLYTLGLIGLETNEEEFNEFENSHQASEGRYVEVTKETKIYKQYGNMKVPIDATELVNESEVELWLYADPENKSWVVVTEVILLQAGPKLDD